MLVTMLGSDYRYAYAPVQRLNGYMSYPKAPYNRNLMSTLGFDYTEDDVTGYMAAYGVDENTARRELAAMDDPSKKLPTLNITSKQPGWKEFVKGAWSLTLGEIERRSAMALTREERKKYEALAEAKRAGLSKDQAMNPYGWVAPVAISGVVAVGAIVAIIVLTRRRRRRR